MDMHTVNLYDFDGVLASPFEEALFTLPETDHDPQFIRAVSNMVRLNIGHESPLSQRYICLQAVLWYNHEAIEHGPIQPQMGIPFNILTARCDRFAVMRMHDHIQYSMATSPIKTMHLDHLPKGQMIQVMLDRHPDTQFRFWDDNPRHVESALALKSDRLEVFHVDNDMKHVYQKAESFYRKLVSQWI